MHVLETIRIVRVKSVSVTAIVLLISGSAYAREDNAIVNNNQSQQQSIPAAEILHLKPVQNSLKAPNTLGILPNADPGVDTQGVMTKEGIVENDTNDTRAYGSFGIPYTTTRVQDGSTSASGVTNANRLSTTYPYRTVGKLTFSAGYCSATVIRKGIIVTAAHCIQDFGTGSNIYSNFQFRPGHYGASGATAAQIAPYGTWNWIALVRPSSWASGADTGSGAARNNDLAVIALAKNSAGKFIGDVTGQLGYAWNNYSFVTSSKTGNLHTALASTLGYPFLMDSGSIMQRTDGPTYTTTVSGAKQLWQGSNLTGGSSGGPWVVNFASSKAVLAGGASPGTASIMAVVGVTSWGSADPNTPKDNYSSQFAQNTQYPNASYGSYGAGNIGSLLNTLCNTIVNGSTLASQGYCN